MTGVGSASVSDLSSLVDPPGRTASIVLGTNDLGTDVLRDLRKRTDAFVRERLQDEFEVRFTGDYWEIARGNEVIVGDQLKSVIGSFVLIFLLVGLFLRSWRLTLLCLPPNIIPLLAGLGFMGAAGIALRVGTSIILPVALGIAVDTTTHYLTRAREEWERDGDYAAAVQRALVGTGWGIVSSTLVLVVGFLAYQVPPFLAFNQVGTLTSFTLLVALMANLFLTPMLVLWTKPFGPGRGARAGVGGPDHDRLTAAS